MHKPNIVRTFSWSPKGLLYQSQKEPQRTLLQSLHFPHGKQAQAGKRLGHPAGAWKTGRSFSRGCGPSGCVTPRVLLNLSGPRTGSLPCPGPCLSLGCYRTKYHRLSSLDNINCFPHSAGGWEVQDQVTGRFSSW